MIFLPHLCGRKIIILHIIIAVAWLLISLQILIQKVLAALSEVQLLSVAAMCRTQGELDFLEISFRKQS